MKKHLTNTLIISALCILIGVAPLVAFINTTQSSKNMLKKELYSKDSLLVSINLNEYNATYEDFKRLKEQMPELTAIIPISSNNVEIRSYKSSVSATVKAVGSDFWKFAALEINKGTFIQNMHLENNLNVAVIDDLTADEIFGTTDVVGRTFDVTINGVDFKPEIIGVCKRMDSSEYKINEEQRFIYIPITMLDNNLVQYNMQEVILAVKEHQMEEVRAKITHFLEGRGIVVNKDDIKQISQLKLIESFITDNISLLWSMTGLWLVAAILGITNIMLVDIERSKKYYGLLRFYGSTSYKLKNKVFFKAYVIAISCSVISIILGIAASAVICSILNINIYISIHSLALGVIVPIAVCMAASVYPAYRASRVDVNNTIWQLD